jgi:hypothetical protein
MSTQSASAAGSGARTVVTVVSTDTYISSALTEPVTAQLPAGSEMSDGDAIVFECTGGSLMVIETEAGRHVGVVPGDGQAVVVYEPGDTGDDFWRFSILAQSPAATVADVATNSSTALQVDHATDAASTAAALAASESLQIGTLAISATVEDFKTTTTFIGRVGGIQVDKAATDNLGFSAADTINTAAAAGQYWGVWLVQINAAGTVSTKPGGGLSDQVYADEATAIAALPAVDAGNISVGHITVRSKEATAWTANTDALDATDSDTVNFYDTAVTDLVTTQIAALVTAVAALVSKLNANATKINTDMALLNTANTNDNALATKLNLLLAALEKRGFLKAE